MNKKNMVLDKGTRYDNSQNTTRIVMLCDDSLMSRLFLSETFHICHQNKEFELVLRVNTSTQRNTHSPQVPKIINIIRLIKGNIGFKLLTEYFIEIINCQWRSRLLSKIPTHSPKDQNINSKSSISYIKSFSPDLILVMGCDQIISNTFLKQFPNKIVNFHWSLLPNHKGRGATLIPLLDGSKYTGVTYHTITKDLDGGDILDQHEFNLSNITKQSQLHFVLIMTGIKSIRTFITKWHKKELTPTPQKTNDIKPITSKQLSKRYYLDPSLTAQQLVRRMQIMGYQIDPQSGLCITDLRISDFNQQNEFSSGEVISKSKKGIEIKVNSGSILIKSFLYLPTVLSVKLWEKKNFSSKK